MKGQKKIIEEIKAVGLQVKVSGGYNVYPGKKGDYLIYTVELEKLIAVAHKYGLHYYINFEEGYVRLH